MNELLLVLIFLSLFLNLRSAFWVAMGIPVTLLGTMFLLPVFGAYLDSIALAAMILVIAYTTLFSPFWIKLFYRLYGDRPELIENADERPLGRQ